LASGVVLALDVLEFSDGDVDRRGSKPKGVSMAQTQTQTNWTDEDSYWRGNYKTRPYASSADRDYDFYQPGYRYGYDAANRYNGRSWKDVESDLSRNWNTYEHRGKSTWDQIKDAVRDAWDRVTGNQHAHTR